MATTTGTAAQARTTWKIDPSHSDIGFGVRHLMISTVKGRFTGVEGTVVQDEANPGSVDIDVRIDAASIDTREGQRDAHLRSGDFFEVEKYPHLTFTSSGVIDRRGGRFSVPGKLTLHGVTRDVTLDVREEGRATDPWGGERLGFTATATIKRSDYGLTWNQTLETGGLLVGDDVKIALELELLKQ